MELFDALVSCGAPMNRPALDSVTCEQMRIEHENAGISGGIVLRREATVFQAGGIVGNPLISADLARYPSESYRGIWSILPSGSMEFPEPQDLPGAMRKNRISALRLAPETDNFPRALWSFSDYLAVASENHIPTYINLNEGISDGLLGDILGCFPSLPVVLCWHTVWSGDRWFRSLVRRFENIYFELSRVHTEGFYEDFVSRFGSERLLFATGWPEFYTGGAVLHLLHAAIPDADKLAIGSINIRRLLSGVNL